MSDRRSVRAVVHGILVSSVLASGFSSQAEAAELRKFEIAAGSAAQALNEFSRQAGVQVFFDAAALRHLKTHAVSGELEVADALQRMLASTSLLFEFVNDRTIAVMLQGAPRPGTSRPSQAGVGLSDGDAGTALRLAQVDASAQSGSASSASSGELEEVVVTSRVVFTQNDAFGATKMGLSIKDTPQTVNVVTRDMIEFASIESFNDFYKVDASGGPAHAIDNFPRNFYRGFLIQGNNAIRVDGFRMPADIDLDLATFDRFEVVKGPTSTLYGQNTIGGTLNAVSKIPQETFSTNVAVQAGSHDEYRFDGDLTGPIAEGWSYRLVTAYEDANSFLDGATTNLKLIAPSLLFRPSDDTTFMLRANFQRHEDRYHFGQAAQLAGTPIDAGGDGIDVVDILTSVATDGLKVPEFARSQFFNAPWAKATKEALLVQSQAEHSFANDWKLRGNLQYGSIKVKTRGVYNVGPYDDQGFAYFTSAYAEDGKNEIYGGEVNLFGDVELGGHKHTLFFGLDYARIDDHSRTATFPLAAGYPGNVFDTNDFSFLQQIPPYTHFSDYDYVYDEDRETVMYGGTVQLIVRPADRVSVLLGARASHDTLVGHSRFAATAEELDQTPFVKTRDFTFDEITAQAGLVYELTPKINAYASYGETFEPSTRFAFDPGNPLEGKAIAPEEGTSYEIGLKGDLTRDLSFSLAAFRMERSNISQRDPQNPRFFVPLGTQVSRGVEAELRGRLTPEWNVFLSAAYMDAQFDGGEFDGLQPANAPKFGVSMFTSYEILEGSLKGLGFGLGAVHKSGRKSFDSFLTRTISSFVGELVPIEYDFGSFTELDARVFYGWDRWKIHATVTNLLNEKYYSPTRNFLDSGIHVNPPTAVRVGLSYSF